MEGKKEKSMSILTKGMEIPNKCSQCPLVLSNNKINKLMLILKERIKNEREMAVKSLSLSVDNPRHIESVYNAYANGMEKALEYILYYLGDFIDECDN